MPKLQEHQIYITTNQRHTIFYTGISNNLKRRIWQHKRGLINGFTKKYNIDKLVYYKSCLSKAIAAKREKEIKGWTKQKKINLVKTINPEFKDLSKAWFGFKK